MVRGRKQAQTIEREQNKFSYLENHQNSPAAEVVSTPEAIDHYSLNLNSASLCLTEGPGDDHQFLIQIN